MPSAGRLGVPPSGPRYARAEGMPGETSDLVTCVLTEQSDNQCKSGLYEHNGNRVGPVVVAAVAASQ